MTITEEKLHILIKTGDSDTVEMAKEILSLRKKRNNNNGICPRCGGPSPDGSICRSYPDCDDSR